MFRISSLFIALLIAKIHTYNSLVLQGNTQVYRKFLIIIILRLVTAANRERTNSQWAAITDAKTNIDIEPRHNDVTRAEVTSFRRLLDPTHE